MRKRSSLLLAIIILLGILAGCGQKVDERTLSVFELTLSDKIKDEVQAAYIQSYEEEHGSTPDLQWTWEDTTVGQIDTYARNCRYYGTLNGCVVWFWPEDQEAFSQDMPGTPRTPNNQFDLGNVHFDYGSVSDFHVYKDGTYYRLGSAWNQGLISEADAAIIAERHRACREDFFGYGSYGDWNVWYVNDQDGEKTEQEIANAVFNCKTGSEFHVTNGKKDYDLTQAYKKGILTEADIAELARKHNAWTPNVVELEYSDKDVEALEAAYKQKLSKDTEVLPDAEAAAYLEKRWEMNAPQQNNVVPRRNGAFVYYGTFGNCAVWFQGGFLAEEVKYELAGAQFYHPSSCTFYVCTEGKLITLQEAYEQGIIFAEDIAVVAVRHAEYHAE